MQTRIDNASKLSILPNYDIKTGLQERKSIKSKVHSKFPDFSNMGGFMGKLRTLKTK